jgi:hypothetical protein
LLVFEFVVALIDYFAVPVGGVPDFGTVKSSAVAADYLAGKYIGAAVQIGKSFPFAHFFLRQVEQFRGDYGRVALFYIVLLPQLNLARVMQHKMLFWNRRIL